MSAYDPVVIAFSCLSNSMLSHVSQDIGCACRKDGDFVLITHDQKSFVKMEAR